MTTPSKALWTPSRDPAIQDFLGHIGMEIFTPTPSVPANVPQTPTTPSSASRHASMIELIRKKSEMIKAEANQRLEREQEERLADEKSHTLAARERAEEAVEEAERKQRQVEEELKVMKAKVEEGREVRVPPIMESTGTLRGRVLVQSSTLSPDLLCLFYRQGI